MNDDVRQIRELQRALKLRQIENRRLRRLFTHPFTLDNYGSALLQARTRLNMTQQELAKAAKVSARTVDAAEDNRRASLKTLEKLFAACNLEMRLSLH